MNPIVAVTMPKFGLAMTEGKVASLAKGEGTPVAVGDGTDRGGRRSFSPRQRNRRLHRKVPGQFCNPARRGSRHGRAGTAHREIAGRPIRYLETGTANEGRPVVLPHSFGIDLNSWLFVQPALSEHHRVIGLDLPGHGGSAKHVGAGDLASLAATVLGFLQAIDAPKAHLVGHSLGGAVALRAALGSPSHVASLSLICPAGLGREIDDDFTRDFITAARRKPRHAEDLPPTVRTHVLSGAGHMPHLEKASEVSRLLLEFVD